MGKQNKPSYPFSNGSSAVVSNTARPTMNKGPLPPSAQRGAPITAASAAPRPYPSQNNGSGASSSANLLAHEYQPRYQDASPNSATSVSDRFALSHDVAGWGSDVNNAENDDFLHNPDPKRDRKHDKGGTIFTWRGFANLGFLLFLAAGLLTLFAGYPLISHFSEKKMSTLGGYNVGGINASGQVPEMSGHFALIDPDTPQGSYNFKTFKDGSNWELVFSDEFNTEGRTFYPGDDPYWEAVDLHYWATGDSEWYDPSALVTKGGDLKITLSEEPIHGLDYKGGHMSSWNKFCFTGGYIEVNVSLPGAPDKGGLWPAVWMMGNLGRAGYGATTEGTWPYSYDSCDWGTLPNQSYNGMPEATLKGGDKYNQGKLSFMPGQRLSACTCPNDPDHPGPKRPDGTFYGRSAPELDVFEAITSPTDFGQVSQSCQTAPFNAGYNWSDTVGTDIDIYNTTNYNTLVNEYKGSVWQEAVSCLSRTNQQAYEETGGYTTYGVEYVTGPDGYITWVNDGKPAWTMYPSAVGPDSAANISARTMIEEPLYIIMNLGISDTFGTLSPDLVFPVTMAVDYVRVYQDPSKRNVGCDPEDFPTADYINKHIEIYSNPNLTVFHGDYPSSYNHTFPKNMLIDACD